MPRRYPVDVRRQVVELARAGTRVAQLSVTFGMTETTVYNWLNQEKIDRGEVAGFSTDQGRELAHLGLRGLPTRRLPKGAKVVTTAYWISCAATSSARLRTSYG